MYDPCNMQAALTEHVLDHTGAIINNAQYAGNRLKGCMVTDCSTHLQ
jgi:hypothetical protein